MSLRHLFLTERGEPMPRWLEAFPGAEVLNPSDAKPRYMADVVWLHLSQSNPDVAGQVRRAAGMAAGVPLVVMSNVLSDEEGLVCLESGAVGYVSSLAVPEMLSQVVEVVRNSGLWVGPELLLRLRNALTVLGNANTGEPRLAALSQREKEVALAVAAGASNKEIARDMGITERTVKAHLTAIFERLNVRDRLQLSILVNGERAQVGEVVS